MMQSLKLDLTTRLAKNLLNDQNQKNKGKNEKTQNLLQGRSTTHKSGAKTSTGPPSQIIQTTKIISSTARMAPQSIVKTGETTSRKQRTSSRLISSNTLHTLPSKKLKKSSKETLGFKVMGSGKASYLTNVGVTCSHSGQKNYSLSSRNITSPYATAGKYPNRFMPKDTSTGCSLPDSKVISRSPPLSQATTVRDSEMMKAGSAIQQPKSQNFITPTLKHQLKQINNLQVALEPTNNSTSPARKKSSYPLSPPPQTNSQQSFVETQTGIICLQNAQPKQSLILQQKNKNMLQLGKGSATGHKHQFSQIEQRPSLKPGQHSTKIGAVATRVAPLVSQSAGGEDLLSDKKQSRVAEPGQTTRTNSSQSAAAVTKLKKSRPRQK